MNLAAVIQQVCYPLGLGPIPPKGWPIQLGAVETLQNTHNKYVLYVCGKQIYCNKGADHCTLGIIKSMVYERPTR